MTFSSPRPGCHDTERESSIRGMLNVFLSRQLEGTSACHLDSDRRLHSGNTTVYIAGISLSALRDLRETYRRVSPSTANQPIGSHLSLGYRSSPYFLYARRINLFRRIRSEKFLVSSRLWNCMHHNMNLQRFKKRKNVLSYILYAKISVHYCCNFLKIFLTSTDKQFNINNILRNSIFSSTISGVYVNFGNRLYILHAFSLQYWEQPRNNISELP